MQSAEAVKKKRTPGLFELVVAGLSGAIGFEIFVLLDYAYFNLAGPDILIALFIGGSINLLIMLSYCELATAIPRVGGEYSFIKTAYGGYISFIAGCFRWLASIFAAALAALAFVLQLAYLLSAISPEVQTAILGQSWLIATFVVAALTIVEIKGAKKIETIIVIAIILLFSGFIIGGLTRGLGPINLFSAPLSHGVSGVFAAVVYVFPMFFGTKSLISTAQRTKRPEKDIPRGLLLSAVIIVPLYILLALIAVGNASSGQAPIGAPLLGLAAVRVFGGYGGVLFAIAGMAASVVALGTSLSVQSSISRGMSLDGYFPKILLSTNRRFGTYHIAAVVGAVLVVTLSALGALPFLGYAASFGSLFVFAAVNLSLIKLRKTKPHIDRPFKTPFYPITPALGVLLSLILLVFPVLIGDRSAGDALVASIGLTGMVLGVYYLRMAGRYRLQIALGGMSLGVGISLAILAFINILGVAETIFPFIPSYIQLFLSVVLIVTGYFNFSAGAKIRTKHPPRTAEH